MKKAYVVMEGNRPKVAVEAEIPEKACELLGGHYGDQGNISFSLHEIEKDERWEEQVWELGSSAIALLGKSEGSRTFKLRGYDDTHSSIVFSPRGPISPGPTVLHELVFFLLYKVPLAQK